MKTKNCPHCGATLGYYGRRDLVNVIARLVSRLSTPPEYPWGDGFALGYLSGALDTALGLCPMPSCSAPTATARQAFLDQLRADDAARDERLAAYLEENRRRMREREEAPIQPSDLQAPDLARGFRERGDG